MRKAAAFPDAEGDDAIANGAEAKGLRRRVVGVFAMGREFAVLADELAIPVDLVDVVDALDEQGEVGGCSGRGGDVDMASIPGVAGVGGMALGAPGAVGVELLPAGVAGLVVDVWRGETGVVAEMKLPWTLEFGGAFAESVDGEGGDGGGGCGGGNGGRGRLRGAGAYGGNRRQNECSK